MRNRFIILLAGVSLAAAPALAQQTPEEQAAAQRAQQRMLESQQSLQRYEQDQRIDQLELRLDTQENQRKMDSNLQRMDDEVRRMTTPPPITFYPQQYAPGGSRIPRTPEEIAASNERLRQIAEDLKTTKAR